jgi:hypothetical protein
MCNKGVHVYQSNGLVHVPIDLNYWNSHMIESLDATPLV